MQSRLAFVITGSCPTAACERVRYNVRKRKATSLLIMQPSFKSARRFVILLLVCNIFLLGWEYFVLEKEKNWMALESVIINFYIGCGRKSVIFYCSRY